MLENTGRPGTILEETSRLALKLDCQCDGVAGQVDWRTVILPDMQNVPIFVALPLLALPDKIEGFAGRLVGLDFDRKRVKSMELDYVATAAPHCKRETAIVVQQGITGELGAKLGGTSPRIGLIVRKGKGRVCRCSILALAIAHVKLHRQATHGVRDGLHCQRHSRHLHGSLGRHGNVRIGRLSTEEPRGQRVGEAHRRGRGRLRISLAEKACERI